MNDRIIIRGFFPTDTATHSHYIPSPIQPIGFAYANRNAKSVDCEDCEDCEDRSTLDLDYATSGFKR